MEVEKPPHNLSSKHCSTNLRRMGELRLNKQKGNGSYENHDRTGQLADCEPRGKGSVCQVRILNSIRTSFKRGKKRNSN